MRNRVAILVAAVLFTGCLVVAAPPPDAGPPGPTATATTPPPGEACTPDKCGPAPGMPNKLCADGKTSSGPTGKCLPTGGGSCGWEIAQCPAENPPVGATGTPVSTSTPTATATATPVPPVGTAQPAASGQACGSRGMAPCGKDQFCNFPVDASCGAADKPGTCAPIPQVCTRELRWVCGCDGKSYSNPCSANAAGQAYAKPGKCP